VFFKLYQKTMWIQIPEDIAENMLNWR